MNLCQKVTRIIIKNNKNVKYNNVLKAHCVFYAVNMHYRHQKSDFLTKQGAGQKSTLLPYFFQKKEQEALLGHYLNKILSIFKPYRVF